MSASPAQHGPPDLNACRAAARSVRVTSCWPQVREVLRPPGVGIHRSRPPLGLLLYAAARDGRLVWRSAGEFALIEPPIARGEEWASSDAGRTWLGRLDRWWDQLLFGVPPFLLLAVSVPAAFLPVVGLLVALLLVVVAVLYVLVQMTAGLIFRSLRRMRGTSEDSARGLHWTVTLAHLTDPAKADRLLRAALDRSQYLTRANIRPDVAEGTHALMCLERGITTVPARQAVAAAPSATDSGPDRPGVLVVLDGGQATAPLLLAFKAATHGWTGRPVHFGTVLSGNILVSSKPLRAELRREFKEATAGEMELTGVYAATAGRRSGWIMVKGISDWGTGELTDDTRRSASQAAAAFIVRALTFGALPIPPQG